MTIKQWWAMVVACYRTVRTGLVLVLLVLLTLAVRARTALPHDSGVEARCEKAGGTLVSATFGEFRCIRAERIKDWNHE